MKSWLENQDKTKMSSINFEGSFNSISFIIDKTVEGAYVSKNNGAKAIYDGSTLTIKTPSQKEAIFSVECGFASFQSSKGFSILTKNHPAKLLINGINRTEDFMRLKKSLKIEEGNRSKGSMFGSIIVEIATGNVGPQTIDGVDVTLLMKHENEKNYNVVITCNGKNDIRFDDVTCSNPIDIPECHHLSVVNNIDRPLSFRSIKTNGDVLFNIRENLKVMNLTCTCFYAKINMVSNLSIDDLIVSDCTDLSCFMQGSIVIKNANVNSLQLDVCDQSTIDFLDGNIKSLNGVVKSDAKVTINALLGNVICVNVKSNGNLILKKFYKCNQINGEKDLIGIVDKSGILSTIPIEFMESLAQAQHAMFKLLPLEENI